MKIYYKVLLGLSLSAQVFCAPLEARQSTVTVAEAALNRFISRLLTEVATLNTAITGLSATYPTTTLANVQSDISTLTTTIEGASSIASGVSGTVSCTAASAGDVTMLITNLGMAQTFVNSLLPSLKALASSLNASDLSDLGGTISSLESALNGLNVNLQSYAQSLLPCASIFDGTVVPTVQSAVTNTGNSFQNLLDEFGITGFLSGLITTAIP